MPEITETSGSSTVDGSLPYAQDLTSAIATIQYVVERLQALGAVEDSTAVPATIPDVEADAATFAPVPGNVAAVPEKWYAVLVGRQPGVFCGPHSITSNTSRIPGANAPRFDTEVEAQHAFDAALNAGLVERVDVVITRDRMMRSDFPIGIYHL